MWGLGLIGFSLVMDAVTGGLQDKVKARTKALNPEAGEKPVPTMHESMLWTNFSGFLVAIVLCATTGQMTEGVAFCWRNPEVINAIMVYSLASAVGQNFIYYTITQFNLLILTTVTTTRKIFTTVYSGLPQPGQPSCDGAMGRLRPRLRRPTARDCRGGRLPEEEEAGRSAGGGAAEYRGGDAAAIGGGGGR